MERILHYEIKASDDSPTVACFLKRQGYSSANLTDLKKMPESILKNGVWEYMRSLLATGDILTVHIQENESSPNIPPVELPLSIIYEDEDILVVNKPAGMPIHPSLNNYENSLANGLMWYYTEQGKPFIFRCTNRLDRDTSGLTVIAKHLISSSILSSMGARHEIKREYLAIVRGSVTPPSGTIDAPLARTGSSMIERKVDFKHGERAVTHYERLAAYALHAGTFSPVSDAQKTDFLQAYSLIELHLETGRTHQIRVHMKHIGHPLPGDFLYNPDYSIIKRQPLHSYQLEFTHPVTKEVMCITAPVPEDFANAFH